MEELKALSIRYETLVQFFEATEGNYRNALYIRCSTCKHTREADCGDFLFIPGHNCIPILLPIPDAEVFLGRPVDSSECAGILSNTVFLGLYQQWLMLCTASDDICPFHQMLHLLNTKETYNFHVLVICSE